MSDGKVNTHQSPNAIFAAIEARCGLKRNRHPKKLTKTKTLKSKDSDSSTSNTNKKASSQTPMQERNCKSKSKIKKEKLKSQTCKNFSFSLSQPVHSANPTSNKHVLRNWQPPLKILRYDDKENTAENSSHQDIISSVDKVCSEESNGNEEINMDHIGTIVEKAQTESEMISSNGNTSLSQQSTQEYVPTENEMKVEKGKHEDTERAEAETTEISYTFQETDKKEPGSDSHEITCIISNKDVDPSNIRIKADENDCNTSSTEHLKERMDQCFVYTMHTQNNSSQVSIKEHVGRKQDMKDKAGETSRENIMNKSDNTTLPPDNFLTKKHKSSDCKDEANTKSNSVMLQIPSLTVKSPAPPAQHMCSITTITKNVEESPLPLNLILKNTWNHSQLTLDKSEEMEPTNIQTMSQAATTFMVSEQKCEQADVSRQILTAQAKTEKNKHLSLMATEEQTVCNFENELVNKCEKLTSNFLSDLPVNKTEVNSDKMIKNTALSPTVATNTPGISNAESAMLQRHTEQREIETTSQSLDTMTPKILPDNNLDLNNQLETPKMAINVCDMKTAMIRHREVEKFKTTPYSLDTATSDNYLEKNKSSTESQITAANKCNEEYLTERYEKASNTTSCNNNNEIDVSAGIDNCSKQPDKDTEYTDDVKVENTELPNAEHPSTSKMNEFLPKENEMSQSKVGLNTFKDKFCKSPTAAAEAPNVCNMRKINMNPLTYENIPDTASHGYLLDDDIGLTGSQLLRIEDECQYNIRSAQQLNRASNYGKSTVPDTSVSTHTAPPPNWAQNMYEKRQKLRSIIQDISRINAMLTRVRKEMWPLPHSATPGILKSGQLTGTSKGTGPRWGPNAHNM